MNLGIELAERGWLADRLIRIGIRRQLSARIPRPARYETIDAHEERIKAFVARMRDEPIAADTSKANEQHYEVPAAFFVKMLGPRLKYSSCLWPGGVETLAAAEEAMLDLTCRRAQLGGDMDILELGCGWGSLSLWMAEKYPTSRITAVSNSHLQREFIEAQADARKIKNLHVVTSDMNEYYPLVEADRIVSVEMFEHMRNHELLLSRIASWLKPGGQLFIHIFVHRLMAYTFDTDGQNDWMARHFFTGGIMPADAMLQYLQRDLRLVAHWNVNGQHYARTLEAWLEKLDASRSEALAILAEGQGKRAAKIQLQRWRMFLMACAELFNYRRGGEWYVSHYRMRKRDENE